MIHLQELRVGNIILNDNKHLTLKVRDLVTIMNRPEHYAPVPLTSTLLESCGFSWEGMWLQIPLDSRRLYLGFYNGDADKINLYQKRNGDSFNNMRMDFNPGHCTALHTLQNLYFTLTGEELLHSPLLLPDRIAVPELSQVYGSTNSHAPRPV
jgi:hypothetical protein